MPSEVLESSTPKQRTAVRQASLVQAAVVLAAQRSPAEITTTDLARAVGITQGAVFRHFPSKEAVWLAVLDWATEALLAELHAGAADAQHPLAALQAVFRAHVDFVVRHPGIPRLVFQELQHAADTPLKEKVRTLMQRYRTLVVELLRQAMAQGRLDPDVDLEAATVLFIGSVQGLVMQALVSGNVTAMALLAPRVFRHFLFGISNPGTGSAAMSSPAVVKGLAP